MLRRHRHKILAQISPLSNFCKRFHRAVAYSWDQFFWLHEREGADGVLHDELNAELDWAQKRPGSLWHGRRQLKATDPMWAPDLNYKELEKLEETYINSAEEPEPITDLCADVQQGGPFIRALTQPELQNMLSYAWRWPDQAWQLNQVAELHARAQQPAVFARVDPQLRADFLPGAERA